MKKYVFSFVMILLMILSTSSVVFAHKRGPHDKELELVLFGGKATKEQKAAAKALEAAAYLTIDQFKGTGQKELDLLAEYIDDLPEVDEINISGSETNHHREYTHQGWNSNYRNIQANNDQGVDEEWNNKWKKRKKILEDTVEEIFEFNWWSNIPLIGNMLPDYGEQCDSLCALIYYIHLLGDHEVTEKMEQFDYLMPVGGKINHKDIINELLYHCNVLFTSNSDTYEFSMFTIKMEEVNNKYYKLIKIDSGNIETNKKYAKEILEIMQEYIPGMLEQEDFYPKLEEFQNVA